MKAILMAGGCGTRFGDCAKVVSKHLLPVYNKPLIYYQIELLSRIGIKEIALIVNQRDLFEGLLDDGSRFGVKISYFTQPEPAGIAQAFLICEEWLEGEMTCLALGDNIFIGQEIEWFANWIKPDSNFAVILAYESHEPSKYGVVTLAHPPMTSKFCPLQVAKAMYVEEKPIHPKTNLIVPGLYFIGNSAPERVKKMKPSIRGELEITDLLNSFIADGTVIVGKLTEETKWFDVGNCDSLLEVSNYIHQGLS